MAPNIFIIGVGQIGSRHLQAIKKLPKPVYITAVDPSADSLKIAQVRYQEVENQVDHKIKFLSSMPVGEKIDLAIIATSSDIRARVAKELVVKNKVKNIVLEKLLFQNKKDYAEIDRLLFLKKIKAWVNCPMRVMPFFKDIFQEIKGKRFAYYATCGKPGLMTSAIHYLDHMAFLSGSIDFKVRTDYLDPRPIPSKRIGFIELTGTLIIEFKNGKLGFITFFPSGGAPTAIEVHSENFRCIAKWLENEAWFSKSSDNWTWKEAKPIVQMQSQLTDKISEDILSTGNCGLPSYRESAKIHLSLLEPIREFLNKKSDKKYKGYPFT